ncbi:hypothetical protein V3C99_014800 [Haemonchus contortus]|uniref:50S ribosomal protein L18 n=1 Tax=Haemonchus contortus TaxID=6289 RepID=A0A7I5ECB6_HAECO
MSMQSASFARSLWKGRCSHFSYMQVQKGNRSSELRQHTKIRDAVAHAKKSKIRFAGHVMRYRDDRWPGRLLAGRQTDTSAMVFFTKASNERIDSPLPD